MKNRIFLVAVCLAVFIFCTACGAEKPEMESSGLPKVCVNDDIGQMNHIKYAENSDELIEGNPWSESLGITELPVFETRLYQNGEFHSENGFSQEEAVERARQIAEALHLTVDNIDTSSYNPDMSKEYAMIKADCGDAVINIGLGGMKYIQYQKNPLELPAGYEFDPRSEVQTEKAANWLIEKYSKPLGIENPKFFVRKEYGQNGSCLHNVGVYSQNENSVNTLLSYNFSPWFFQPEIVVDVEKNEPSYSGRLSAIVCEGRLDLMHEIANYPIISIDEARNELLSGNFYFAEDNDESLCPKNEDIACVELIYDTTECEVSIPYYRFWVSVSQDYIDQHMHEFSEKSIEAGVMPYFSFYVPAIQSNYLDNVYDYSINEDCTLDSFFCNVSNDGLFVANAEISGNGKKYCLNFDGQFFLFGPEYIPVSNKAIGNIHSSNYQILSFSASRCNDMYSPDIVIESGQVLIKIAFIAPNEKSAVSVKWLTELSNYPDIREFVFDDANTVALDSEIVPTLVATEHWFVPFIKENRIQGDDVGYDNASDPAVEDLFGIDAVVDDTPVIEEFIYQPNGEPIRMQSEN